MHCTHCEKCCQDTEMELCESDIRRLERAGFSREEFSRLCADGVRRLSNVDGHCYFYDSQASRCKAYARRPLGCVIYPVNLTPDGVVIVDDLCPQAHTVTSHELVSKGLRLRRLIDTITKEAHAPRK